jgi:protocatechuate 3,4-dioxygenase beta subunit
MMHDRLAIHDETRRQFIKRASLFAAVFPALPFAALDSCSKPNTILAQTNGVPCGACDAPAKLSWRTVISAASEPGELLVMSGTIYQPDGVTPAEGIALYVYHTDATGYYNERDDAFHPRLRGWMRTGRDGKYEFRTIKPAPYPHRTTPAHIHAHVYGPGYPEYSIDDYWFAGDRFITPSERAKLTGRGGFPSIITLERDANGLLRGTRNIKLEQVQAGG